MAAPVNRLESMWTRSDAQGVESLEQDRASFGNRANKAEHSLEGLFAKHPRVAIAAAAVVGIALGWIVKRK